MAAPDLDDDPARLDMGRLHRWLSQEAYWSRGLSRERLAAAVEGSWCLGAYADDRLVGFARLASDRATHAWLCDVFVDAPERGRGIGRAMVERCLEQCSVWGVRRVMLATKDAHELYRGLGFTDVDTGRFLERRLGPAGPGSSASGELP